MRRLSLTLLLTTLPLLALAQASNEKAAACDRACLEGYVDNYLDALLAHQPARLPLADDVRFTEDAVEMKLGAGGLWKTAAKLRPYRQDILDVQQGIATSHVVIEEGVAPVLLSFRLKIAAGRITEIESMVVRNQKEGMIFEVAALTAATEPMNKVPPRAQRNSRAEAIEMAQRYPAGLKIGSFVKSDVPFAPGAYRFENGRRMAGPGCSFQPPSCENIKEQRIPTLAGIRHRVVAFDEELGIVLLRMDFGPGSTFAGGDQSLSVWEWFKVYDDQIHAVEAFMEVKPASGGSGWD